MSASRTSETPIITALTGDLFKGAPPPSCPSKHPQWPERAPDLYVEMTRDDHRARTCDIARGIIADPTLDDWTKSAAFGALFNERLQAQIEAATDPTERAMLRSLGLVAGRNLHALANLRCRVRDILARRGEEA